MPKVSAGLLMVRERGPAFFLVHPGGPFFRARDEGVWTIPKGLVAPGEALLEAAKREFREETGLLVVARDFVPLGHIRQKGGKIVHAWAFRGDCDPAAVTSNTCSIEWPRGSGRRLVFPEVDRAGFFDEATARVKLLEAQVPFIDRAIEGLGLARPG